MPFDWTKTVGKFAGVTALAGALLIGSPAAAHEAEETSDPNTGAISLGAGTNVSTHYFFRGILQEDQGFITQPWAELGFNLYEGTDGIDSVDLSVGIWNSFHDEETGEATSDGADSWYEADLYAGVGVSFLEDFSAGLTYTAYTSPNDAFTTIEEISLSFGYDDSGLWEDAGVEDFALNPSLTAAFEIDETAYGPDEGIYLDFGIAPSFTIVESGDYPITLTVPVTVGLGLSDYYETTTDDDHFGYVDLGLDFSMPLAFMPAEFGAWEAGVGAHFLFLGDNLETTNNGDDFEVIGTFSLSMSY